MDFYGYEQPLVMLFESFFNPTSTLMMLSAMQNYTNALREDYKEAVNKLDLYNEKYGLFTSLSDADMQGVNDETRGRISRKYDELMARGIDPLRSVEGRAELMNTVRNTDYGYIARAMLSAKNLEAYNAMKKLMIADGTYNQALQDFMGVQDSTKWDSRNGIFQETSPYRFMNELQLVDPIASKLKPEFLEIKNGYMVTGISKDKIKQAIIDNKESIFQTPSGKYFASMYGGEDKAIDAMSEMASQVYKTEERKPDEFAVKDHDLNNTIKLKGIEREWAQEDAKTAHEYKMEENRAKKGDGPGADGRNLDYRTRSIASGFLETTGVDYLKEGEYKKIPQELINNINSWRLANKGAKKVALSMAHVGSAEDFAARFDVVKIKSSTTNKGMGKTSTSSTTANKYAIDLSMKDNLVTIEDISMTMYGTPFKKAKVLKEQGGRYNSSVINKLSKSKKLKDVDRSKIMSGASSIEPYSGDRSMITILDRQGNIRQYQKVKVGFKTGKKINTNNELKDEIVYHDFWIDYGNMSNNGVASPKAEAESSKFDNLTHRHRKGADDNSGGSDKDDNDN